jgi:hypothetical protein
MVQRLTRDVLELVRSGSDEVDLKRLAEAAVKGGLRRGQRQQVAKIAVSLQEHAKSFSGAQTLIEAAKFREDFAPRAIEQLFSLSNLLWRICDPEAPREVADLRKELMMRLTDLWKEAYQVEHGSGPGGTGVMDEETFTILLLTDFHWGAPGCEIRWRDVQQRFLDAITRACAGGTKIDLVIFSGDLVFSGKWEEYDGLGEGAPKQFNAFLTELWANFRKRDIGDPLLLAVPGNHDLRWPCSPEQLKLVKKLKTYADRGSVWEEIWKKRGGVYRDLFRDAFEGFIRWQEANRKHQIDADRREALGPLFFQRGDFPGEFSCRFKKGKKVLGIVGLNSAFLQLSKGNFEGRVALESEQLQGACAGDGAKWLGPNDANVLVTHHPMEWLYREWQKTFYERICSPDWFDVHLHGHLHEPGLLQIARGGGNTLNSVQGISLFGREKYTDSKGKSQDRLLHGYVIVQIRTRAKENLLRFQQRKLTEDGRDVPAIEQVKANEDGWTNWVDTRQLRLP